MTDNGKQSMKVSGPISAKHFVLSVFCILASVLCPLSAVHAEGIRVNKAEARFSENIYQLSANFDIHFNFVIEQALMRGVTLYFISEFSLTRPRWYWLDETVTQSEQTTRLFYNALTRQYRVARGSLFQNFSSLEAALKIIGHQTAPPINANLLEEDDGYIAALLPKNDADYIAATRLRLDVTQLPKPLQINALAAEDWSLDSGWYRWIVRPAAALSAAEGEDE